MIFVYDNMVYIGPINSSNITWQCVDKCSVQHVFQSPGEPEACSWCSPPLYNYDIYIYIYIYTEKLQQKHIKNLIFYLKKQQRIDLFTKQAVLM